MCEHKNTKVGESVSEATKNLKEGIERTLGGDPKKGENTEGTTSEDTKHKASETKQYAEGAKDDVTGSVKSKLGDMSGDKSTQAEGECKKVSGEAKKAMNS